MSEKCKNKDCVLHTEVCHGASCATSGSNKCQDSLHNKECFTKEDVSLLSNIFDNYIKSHGGIEHEENAVSA